MNCNVENAHLQIYKNKKLYNLVLKLGKKLEDF